MPKRFGLDGGGKGDCGLPPPPPPSATSSAAGAAAARVAPPSSPSGQLLALAVASPALAAAGIAGEEAETRIPGADGKGGMEVRGGGDGLGFSGGIMAPVRERLRASGTMAVGSSCGEVCSGCSHRRGAHAEPAEMMREVVMVRA